MARKSKAAKQARTYPVVEEFRRPPDPEADAARLERLARSLAYVEADVTVWCEKTGKMDFVARFYDRVTERFYSGAASTALEAIAWAFDDYVCRAGYGLGPSMSRDSDAVPGSRALALRGTEG